MSPNASECLHVSSFACSARYCRPDRLLKILSSVK
nr:MAG TPA: hypothetical protein [Caudoviricetes sp.]DAK97980.1 MAG TPA: hypothetical protein [Ackermannviridae sp.]